MNSGNEDPKGVTNISIWIIMEEWQSAKEPVPVETARIMVTVSDKWGLVIKDRLKRAINQKIEEIKNDLKNEKVVMTVTPGYKW